MAAAAARLEKGRPVLMLDGGQVVTPADPALATRLRDTAPENWTGADVEQWRAPQYETPSGQVRRFGSDAGMLPASAIYAEEPTALRASHALGGLSNLWGAATRAYDADDMGGWPVSEAQMQPHYEALRAILPQNKMDEIGLGPQAARLLAQSDRWLRPASVAVEARCRHCGLCLHGCPDLAIWSAARVVDGWRDHPGFHYRSGPPVRAVEELADGVAVTLADGQRLTGARLFVGAGVLETARLMLQLGRLEQVTLRDSQFGFVPLLQKARSDGGQPMTTLPQLFARLPKGVAGDWPAHAQIYGWNEFYLRDLLENYGAKLPGTSFVWRALAARMMVAQIFLHSDYGARINLRLAGGGKLAASTDENPEFAAFFSKARRAMARRFMRSGALMLGPATRIAAPGSSYHVGASLPIAAHPGDGQSDLLGRPFGLDRIHLVDASSLPAIAASTITLAVMANAHRIAAQV